MWLCSAQLVWNIYLFVELVKLPKKFRLWDKIRSCEANIFFTYQNQLPGMPQSALKFSVGGGVGGGPTNYFVTTNSSWCLVWLWQFERNSQTLLLSILRFSKWLNQNWLLWFPVFTVRQLIFLYLKNTNIMFIHLVLTKTFLSRK